MFNNSVSSSALVLLFGLQEGRHLDADIQKMLGQTYENLGKIQTYGNLKQKMYLKKN